MKQLDVIFIGAVMNYDGNSGSYANYIRQDDKWLAPFQYIYQKRPHVFRDEAQACVYGVPNLSICKLADYLKRKVADIRFHIIWHFEYHREEMLRLLQNDPPHLVAISTTLAFYPKFLNDAIEWINQHKRPETKIVLGGKWLFDQHKLNGAGPKLERTLCDADADYAILSGFGEETLHQLLLAERAGDMKRAQSLPNIAYRVSAAVTSSDRHSHMGVVSGAGGLSLNLISTSTSSCGSGSCGSAGPIEAYRGQDYIINRMIEEDHIHGKPMIDFENVGREYLDTVVHVRTCSSCPFKCKFCTFPVLQGDHVLFDLNDVMVQLRQLKDMGVTHLFFIDDTFNVPRDRFEDLMDLMIKADLGFEWVSFYRAQFATNDNVKKMYDAGCRMVFCGFESGNDHILKLMGKSVTVKKYFDGLNHLGRYGIQSLASYIVGYPGETYETCMDTLKLVNDPRVKFSRGSLFYYDPNAPVSETAKEWELVGFGNDWSHKTMNSKEAARIHLEMMSKTTSINTPVSDGGAWSLFSLFARGLSWDDIELLYREFNDIQTRQVAEAGSNALAQYRSRATQARRRPRRGTKAMAELPPMEEVVDSVPDV